MIFVATRNPIFALLFISLIAISCKSRSYNDESKSKGFFDFLRNEQSFGPEVVGKKVCSPEYKLSHKELSSKTPTKFFHWTNDEYALSHPFEYMTALVKKSNEINDNLNRDVSITDDDSKIKMEGAAGAGLYIAPNPFISSDFGTILISFEINAGTGFSATEGTAGHRPTRSAFDAQKANCPGIIYPFSSRIIGKIPNSESGGKAIVMWDLSGIDSKSVEVFGPKSKISKNFGPHFEYLFANRDELKKIVWAELRKEKNEENQLKIGEIRKYWGEQPSLYDWQ